MRKAFQPEISWRSLGCSKVWLFSYARRGQERRCELGVNMVIKYFAYYRSFAGRKEESLLLGPLSAIELLKKLSELHGSTLRKEFLTEDGEGIHPNLIFLIDGRNIDFLEGRDSIVGEGAVVSLFPRIAGG